MNTLTLHLKAEYFHAIRDGSKPFEYRLDTPYWRTRLEHREYDQIVLCLGYPAKDDAERRLVRPWCGYELQTITHKHFGMEPVRVFAIRVNRIEFEYVNAVPQLAFAFPPGVSAFDLWVDTLQPLGVALLKKVLTSLQNGVIVSVPQDERLATWEPSFGRPPLFRPDLAQIGPPPEGFNVVVTANALFSE